VKIAVEARYLLSEQKTGVEHYTYQLLAAMAAQEGEHELHLYLHRKPRADETVVLKPFFDSQQTYLHTVPNLKLWLKFWMPLAAKLHGADVGFFPGSILPLYNPFPSVMVVHDMCWAYFPEYYPERENKFYQYTFPELLEKAELIFAVSKATKAGLMQLFDIGADKIRVVYNGLNPSFSHIEDAREKVAEQLGLKDKYILAVGTAHPRKNIASLLQAYAIAKPYEKLILIGPQGDNSNPLAKLAVELGIADDVIFPGYAPHKLLPLIYSAASVFVMPSLCEGFGVPIIEAMACGAPVICSNNGALAEVADDAAVLIDPKDPKSLAEGLKKVLSDTSLQATLREKGFNRAKDFNWDESAKLAWKYFEEAASR